MVHKLFEGKKKFFFIALYISDMLSFSLSAYLAVRWLRISPYDEFFLRFSSFTLLILLINYSSFALYRDKRNLFDDSEFMKIVYSIAITFFIQTCFLLIFSENILVWTSVLASALALALIITTISRMILSKIVSVLRMSGHDRRKVIFFGKRTSQLLKKINEEKHLGYKVIGVTEKLSELKRSIHNADIVFIAQEDVGDDLLKLIINHERITWKIIPSVLNLAIDPVSFDEFKDFPILNISPSEPNRRYLVIKRIFDLTVSGISLLILSPLFLAVAAAIKLTMPGPVFFKQERLGKKLKPFQVYKFRSMICEADDLKKKMMAKNEVEGLFKMKNDPRITPFGKFIRRTCIDELPQLINIFKGDMSLVGPRPHLQRELSNFRGWRMARFNVKPGLTGLWQVNGRHELNFDKAVLYDIHYIKHMSLVADFAIIARTIPAIIMSRGRF